MNLRIDAVRTLPLLTLLALSPLACGTPPPAAPAPPAPLAVASNPKDPPVDTSPAPEPPNLVVVARMSKPNAIAGVVGAWAHFPLPSGKELLRSVADDTVADVVDLDQPVDAAVTVQLSRHSVEPLAAFALVVKSFDDAKMRLGSKHRLTPASNGSFRVEGLGKSSRGHAETDQASDDDGGDTCVLAHSATGGRLVCGESAALDALVPYLARTMPRQQWPADIHVEVRPEPVRGPLQDMRGMIPVLARSMMGSSSGAMKELIDASVGEGLDIVGDAQKVTLDAQIAESGIVGTSRFEFQSNKSVFARALTDAGRADATPAAFWHLPGDTDLAFFSRGSDPKLFDHPRQILASLLLEATGSIQMPDPEKKAINDLVGERMLKLFTDGKTGIYAKGFDQAALEKAVKARSSVKPDDWAAQAEARRQVGEQVIGWHLYQVGEPVAAVGPILKDWSALWNRPAFGSWFKTTAGKPAPQMRIAPIPAGVTLPKDTVHLEVTLAAHTPPPEPPGRAGAKPTPPKKPALEKPIVVHLFAVPDGGATWLAFGLDGKLVATKAAAALASAPEAGTLGKVAGSEALRDGKVNGGGIVTVRGIAVVTAFDDADGRSLFSSLPSLPQKGTTPIVFTGRAEAPSAAAKAGASVGTMRISRAVIEDVVKLVLAGRATSH